MEWTDWAGRKHDKMIGRPVSMHAMRGISAHSNGFHTCRAIHVLQILLGSIDVPGGYRYKAPFPKHVPSFPKPAGHDVAPNTPIAGPPLGMPTEPADLLVNPDGSPKRIDKAFSWDNPISGHGLMHMVIHNAWKGDPYPIDTLFMYMSNMSWNSSMNIPGTLKMLTDKDPDTGEYKIPRIIYSDAFYSEMIPYADLILPDTTYLERWDCISLLDRPISSAEGPCRCDSSTRGTARSRRASLPGCADRPWWPGSGCPAFTDNDGTPRYSQMDIRITSPITSGAPGIGPLAGWRGENSDQDGMDVENPIRISFIAYIDNQLFLAAGVGARIAAVLQTRQ